jgi:hypothetical protein
MSKELKAKKHNETLTEPSLSRNRHSNTTSNRAHSQKDPDPHLTHPMRTTSPRGQHRHPTTPVDPPRLLSTSMEHLRYSTTSRGHARPHGTVLIIHDSNGNYLNPQLLHYSKDVQMVRRHTRDEAKKQIPACQSPDGVTDVVLMVGLNDSRTSTKSTATISTKTILTAKAYLTKFPYSRLHISSVAPISPKEIQLNLELKIKASQNDYAFIDIQGMYDQRSGKLRDQMLNGIHFTSIATKILAKELKRSLYSHPASSNHYSGSLRGQPPPFNRYSRSPNQTSSTAVQPPAGSGTSILSKPVPTDLSGFVGALTNFFESASARLTSF